MKIARALSVVLAASAIAACKKPPSLPPPGAAESAPTGDAPPTADAMGTGARDTFEKKFSCPDDRVTLVPRSDIDPMDALAPASELKAATPPPGVKEDPVRYAKWKEDQDAQRESLHATYARNTVFEVNGCGHMEILACQPHRTGATIYPAWPDCFAARGGTESRP